MTASSRRDAVCRLLRENGVRVVDRWVEEAISFLSYNGPVPSDARSLADKIFQLFLDCDLYDLAPSPDDGSPSILPDREEQLKLHRTRLFVDGPIVLQVVEAVDIGNPKYVSNAAVTPNSNVYASANAGAVAGGVARGAGMIGADAPAPPPASKLFKLCLTDGINYMIAYDLQGCIFHWLGNTVPAAGCKIALKNVSVRHGALMLSPTTAKVLGGAVPNFREKHSLLLPSPPPGHASAMSNQARLQTEVAVVAQPVAAQPQLETQAKLQRKSSNPPAVVEVPAHVPLSSPFSVHRHPQNTTMYARAESRTAGRTEMEAGVVGIGVRVAAAERVIWNEKETAIGNGAERFISRTAGRDQPEQQQPQQMQHVNNKMSNNKTIHEPSRVPLAESAIDSAAAGLGGAAGFYDAEDSMDSFALLPVAPRTSTTSAAMEPAPASSNVDAWKSVFSSAAIKHNREQQDCDSSDEWIQSRSPTLTKNKQMQQAKLKKQQVSMQFQSEEVLHKRTGYDQQASADAHNVLDKENSPNEVPRILSAAPFYRAAPYAVAGTAASATAAAAASYSDSHMDVQASGLVEYSRNNSIDTKDTNINNNTSTSKNNNNNNSSKKHEVHSTLSSAGTIAANSTTAGRWSVGRNKDVGVDVEVDLEMDDGFPYSSAPLTREDLQPTPQEDNPSWNRAPASGRRGKEECERDEQEEHMVEEEEEEECCEKAREKNKEKSQERKVGQRRHEEEKEDVVMQSSGECEFEEDFVRPVPLPSLSTHAPAPSLAPDYGYGSSASEVCAVVEGGSGVVDGVVASARKSEEKGGWEERCDKVERERDRDRDRGGRVNREIKNGRSEWDLRKEDAKKKERSHKRGEYNEERSSTCAQQQQQPLAMETNADFGAAAGSCVRMDNHRVLLKGAAKREAIRRAVLTVNRALCLTCVQDILLSYSARRSAQLATSAAAVPLVETEQQPFDDHRGSRNSGAEESGGTSGVSEGSSSNESSAEKGSDVERVYLLRGYLSRLLRFEVVSSLSFSRFSPSNTTSSTTSTTTCETANTAAAVTMDEKEGEQKTEKQGRGEGSKGEEKEFEMFAQLDDGVSRHRVRISSPLCEAFLGMRAGEFEAVISQAAEYEVVGQITPSERKKAVKRAKRALRNKALTGFFDFQGIFRAVVRMEKEEFGGKSSSGNGSGRGGGGSSKVSKAKGDASAAGGGSMVDGKTEERLVPTVVLLSFAETSEQGMWDKATSGGQKSQCAAVSASEIGWAMLGRLLELSAEETNNNSIGSGTQTTNNNNIINNNKSSSSSKVIIDVMSESRTR